MDETNWSNDFYSDDLESFSCIIERFSLDCRIGIGFGFGFGFTTSFGWLVYLLWFWFYDSQVKTTLNIPRLSGNRTLCRKIQW